MNYTVSNIKTYVKQELIDVINQLWKKFDKEGKGYILEKDLGTMLRLLDYNPTDKQLKQMIANLEEDTNEPRGVISKEGFLACVAIKEREANTFEELLDCLKLFDKEHTGLLEEKILRYVLCKTGDCLSNEEMDALMKDCLPFTTIVNDLKYININDLTLLLKDRYKPPTPQPQKTKTGKK
jgi:troponin C